MAAAFQTTPVAALAVLALSAGTAFGVPQGYGGGGGSSSSAAAKCRYVNDIKYEDRTETICNTKYERVCQTLYRDKCTPYREEVCVPYQRRQCDDKRKKECRTEYREVKEAYTDTHCEDQYVRKCEKVWQEDGYGGKVFVEDKSSCKDLPKTECAPVQKFRVKKVPYEECDYVNYQDCYDVPDKRCSYKQSQRCQKEPYEDCKDVPKKVCREDHRQVPVSVRRKVCPGHKDWAAVRSGTLESFPTAGASAVVSDGAAASALLDSVSSDAVVFG